MGNVVKVGVIGCGIGLHHINGYKNVPDAEVVALADLDEKKGKKVAADSGIATFYTDYREMLRNEKMDAVSVCVPNFLHSKITIEVLKSGRHVLGEKPMAMNVREAKEMQAIANKMKKILMIGFTHRFRADSQTLMGLINDGVLGNIYHARAYALRRRGIPGLGGWFTTKEKSGGGGLIDIGVHLLDLTMWLMQKPEPSSVSASTYMKFGHKKDYVYVSMWGSPVSGGTFNVDDYASGFVRFANNATLSFEVSWAANIEKDVFYSVILGDKGGAVIDTSNELKIFTELNGKLVDVFPKYAPVKIYDDEMAHFIECIKTGKKPICSAEDGVRVQKVLDAIYLSSKLKKEIKI